MRCRVQVAEAPRTDEEHEPVPRLHLREIPGLVHMVKPLLADRPEIRDAVGYPQVRSPRHGGNYSTTSHRRQNRSGPHPYPDFFGIIHPGFSRTPIDIGRKIFSRAQMCFGLFSTDPQTTLKCHFHAHLRRARPRPPVRGFTLGPLVRNHSAPLTITRTSLGINWRARRRFRPAFPKRTPPVQPERVSVPPHVSLRQPDTRSCTRLRPAPREAGAKGRPRASTCRSGYFRTASSAPAIRACSSNRRSPRGTLRR